MYRALCLPTGCWAVRERSGRLVRRRDGTVWMVATHGEAYALAKQKEREDGTRSGRGRGRG